MEASEEDEVLEARDAEAERPVAGGDEADELARPAGGSDIDPGDGDAPPEGTRSPDRIRRRVVLPAAVRPEERVNPSRLDGEIESPPSAIVSPNRRPTSSASIDGGGTPGEGGPGGASSDAATLMRARARAP